MKKKLLLIFSLMWVMTCAVYAQSSGETESPRVPRYTCVDPHKYPDKVRLTCQLFEGDRQIEDFEVAVFSRDGECRADALSGSDPNWPNIAYVTIHGTERIDKGLIVKVVYGDETDRYKFERIIEGFTIDVYNEKAFGTTLEPFRLLIAGKPAFRWTDAMGNVSDGTVPQLTPELLVGATRLELRGDWQPDDLEKLKGALPNASLEDVSFSSEWLKTDFTGLLANCKVLTGVHFAVLPQGNMEGFLEGSNPNCLVYLPVKTYDCPSALTGRNVVSHTSAGTYLALTNISLVGGTPENPCPFALDKDIDLDRFAAKFIPTNLKFANGHKGWNTIVVPFDAAIYADETRLSCNYDEFVNPNSCWLLRFRRARSNRLTFTHDEYDLKAHLPYIFAVPGDAFGPENSLSSKKITFRNLSNVVKAVPQKLWDLDFEQNPQDIEYIGTYSLRKSVPMYLLSDMKDGTNAFVFAEKGNLLPFRAYMQMREGVAPTSKVLMLDTDILPTAIGSVETDATQVREVFDLSGRRVDDIDEAVPGIYIVNGKKQLKK